jgi:ribonuclease BN (tRNA processing enzyme)
MNNDRVIFLGTSDALSTGGRSFPAILVETGGCSMLLDCGPSALASLRQHGLSISRIDTILISHLHGDHFAGLPFLFLYYSSVEPRRKPLRIIGPPEVEARVMQLFSVMYHDSAEEPLPFKLEFTEISSQELHTAEGISIQPFYVPHQKHPPSFGYVIKSNKRKIVYTGDTGWTEDLVVRAQDSDLFICECSFFETRLDTHLDFPRISENAGRLGSKRIVLTHIGQEVLRRHQEVDLEMAYDGMVVDF